MPPIYSDSFRLVVTMAHCFVNPCVYRIELIDRFVSVATPTRMVWGDKRVLVGRLDHEGPRN